eukprot:sb/3466333/
MLRGLTIEKEIVGDCMLWCLQHADAAEEAARFFLCNDLLYNSCAEVPNASSFRTKLESRLGEIVIHLTATLQEIKNYRNKEKFQRQVHACFKAWKTWNLYSVDYLAQLESIFNSGAKGSQQQVESDAEVDEVDGMPLDVDGIPLAKDVDGEPIGVTDMFQVCTYMYNGIDRLSNRNILRLVRPLYDLSDRRYGIPQLSPIMKVRGGFNPKNFYRYPLFWQMEILFWKFLEIFRNFWKFLEFFRNFWKFMEIYGKWKFLETGKCTRIQRITTMEQTELYRKLLYKGLDARKIIKQVASGKRNLAELHTEISKLPNCKPSPPVAAASSSSGGSSSLVKYADSGDSR